MTILTARKMVKKDVTVLKKGNWEQYQGIFRVEVIKAREWVFDTIKEAFEQVAQDEAEKLNIVQ